MICRPAESSFQKGQKAFEEGRILEAQAFFEASLRLSRESGEGTVQPRYLSYYGVCLSRLPGKVGEAPRTQAMRGHIPDRVLSSDWASHGVPLGTMMYGSTKGGRPASLPP